MFVWVIVPMKKKYNILSNISFSLAGVMSFMPHAMSKLHCCAYVCGAMGDLAHLIKGRVHRVPSTFVCMYLISWVILLIVVTGGLHKGFAYFCPMCNVHGTKFGMIASRLRWVDLVTDVHYRCVSLKGTVELPLLGWAGLACTDLRSTYACDPETELQNDLNKNIFRNSFSFFSFDYSLSFSNTSSWKCGVGRVSPL